MIVHENMEKTSRSNSTSFATGLALSNKSTSVLRSVWVDCRKEKIKPTTIVNARISLDLAGTSF